jgi:hypothetical protein
VILSNQAQCVLCGDMPYSAHVHDFRYCECGEMAVDGGMDYIRRLGNPEQRVEMSVQINQENYDGLLGAITDKTKNDLGKMCNLARYLRDHMGINLGDET